MKCYVHVVNGCIYLSSSPPFSKEDEGSNGNISVDSNLGILKEIYMEFV